jgi:hypothetical protein
MNHVRQLIWSKLSTCFPPILPRAPLFAIAAFWTAIIGIVILPSIFTGTAITPAPAFLIR